MNDSNKPPLLEKVLIKISGEYLAGEQGFGIDPVTLSEIADKIGIMYAKGMGVERDDTEAVKWHRKAAEQGHAESQYSRWYLY